MDTSNEFRAPETATDFPTGETKIGHISKDGRQLAYVLLSEGKIAKIIEGTGNDVESATLIAGGDQKKYFSALMAGCVEIDGKAIVMEDLSLLKMKDYMRIQVAFSEINF